MFGKKKTAPDLAKSQTSELGDVLGRQAGEWANLIGSRAGTFGESAKHLAEKATTEANVYAHKAGKQAKQYADQGAKWASPHIESASRKAQELTETAVDRWEHDVRPRVQAAADAAREEAGKDSSLKDKAVAVSGATSKALQTPPPAPKKKSRKFGWLVVGAATAGIGYFIWKRNQPIEDPWAEAYWEDIAAEDAAAQAVASGEKATVDPLADAQAQVADPVVDEKVDKPSLNEAEAAEQAGLAQSDKDSDLGKPDTK